MPFTLQEFQAKRPYLYHLTDQRNVERIRRTERLYSATYLLKAANAHATITERRPNSVGVMVDGEEIWIRDQRPLHAGNVGFEGGWTFEDLLKALNDKVFFWPGTANGPISYGIRHFQRYASEKPALLRLSTSRVATTNNGTSPLFCRYNSGSPRWSNGVASPRGPSTFVACTLASFSATSVVECVISEQVLLPPCAEVAAAFDGPWRPLFP